MQKMDFLTVYPGNCLHTIHTHTHTILTRRIMKNLTVLTSQASSFSPLRSQVRSHLINGLMSDNPCRQSFLYTQLYSGSASCRLCREFLTRRFVRINRIIRSCEARVTKQRRQLTTTWFINENSMQTFPVQSQNHRIFSVWFICALTIKCVFRSAPGGLEEGKHLLQEAPLPLEHPRPPHAETGPDDTVLPTHWPTCTAFTSWNWHDVVKTNRRTYTFRVCPSDLQDLYVRILIVSMYVSTGG